MYQPEHRAAENNLVHVERSVSGGLLLCWSARLEADNFIAAREDAHKPGHSPFHRLHHGTVYVGRKAALLAVIVHAVAVAEIALFELRALTGELPARRTYSGSALSDDRIG